MRGRKPTIDASEVIALRSAGMPWADIATKIGCSVSGAREAFSRAEQRHEAKSIQQMRMDSFDRLMEIRVKMMEKVNAENSSTGAAKVCVSIEDRLARLFGLDGAVIEDMEGPKWREVVVADSSGRVGVTIKVAPNTDVSGLTLETDGSLATE